MSAAEATDPALNVLPARVADHEERIGALEAWRTTHSESDRRMTEILQAMLGVMTEVRDELRKTRGGVTP